MRSPSNFHLILVLILLIGFASGSKGEAYNVEDFKKMVNEKPIIQDFSFRVSTTKYNLSGMPTNGSRHFTLIYQNSQIYKLTEYQSEYTLVIPDQRNPTNKPNSKMAYTPFDVSYGRYQSNFWNTFNSDGVIATSVDKSKPDPELGPARSSHLMLGVAMDALNLGIMDLGDIGVTWNGLEFSCPSNRNGFKIAGRLILTNSIPKFLDYTIEVDSRSKFHYLVTYSFEQASNVPSSFPSGILIERAEGKLRRKMSDYKTLSFISRKQPLTVSDVSLESELVKRHYVFTNGAIYRSETNGLTRLSIRDNPGGH